MAVQFPSVYAEILRHYTEAYSDSETGVVGARVGDTREQMGEKVIAYSKATREKLADLIRLVRRAMSPCPNYVTCSQIWLISPSSYLSRNMTRLALLLPTSSRLKLST